MRCARCRRLLSAFRERALRPRLARAVALHLAACSACRSLAEEERALVETLAETTPPPLAPALRTRILHTIIPLARTAPAPRWAWSPPRALAWAPVAALLLIFVGLWFAHHRPRPKTAAVATVVVGEVEHRRDALSSWQPLRAGDRLPEGSQILSRERGMALVETLAEVTLSIAPETALAIESPNLIAAERGRVLAEAPRAVFITTPAGRLETRGSGGRLALEVADAVSTAVSRGQVTWVAAATSAEVDLPTGQVTALDPQTASLRPAQWVASSWDWLEALHEARARDLLRETHPSLLPEGGASQW